MNPIVAYGDIIYRNVSINWRSSPVNGLLLFYVLCLVQLSPL